MTNKICPFLPPPMPPLHKRVWVLLTGDGGPVRLRNCLVHDCELYINVQGKDPQNGNTLDNWGCSIRWMPTLQIDTARQGHSTAAAVESFRNEMARQNNAGQAIVRNLISAVAEQKSEPKLIEQED